VLGRTLKIAAGSHPPISGATVLDGLFAAETAQRLFKIISGALIERRELL